MAEPTTVTKSDVQARYPFAWDYADTSLDSVVDAMILEAADDVSEDQFGDLRDRAIIALVAHQMLQYQRAEGGDSGSAKMMESYGAGDVSVSFVSPPPEGLAPTTMQFYTTQPGVDYMELCQRVGTGVRLV